MNDLIEKLEAATKGSRELGALIAEALGLRVKWVGDRLHIPITVNENGHPASKRVRRWTTTIDTALTLVPEGCMKYGIEIYVSTGRAKNGCDFPAGQYSNWIQVREAATPALAVCIASLKERLRTRG